MRSNQLHNLARIRVARGITQKALAEHLGYSHSTIQSIEVGRLKLSEVLAKRLAAYFQIDPRWLLENRLEDAVPTRETDLELEEWL